MPGHHTEEFTLTEYPRAGVGLTDATLRALAAAGWQRCAPATCPHGVPADPPGIPPACGCPRRVFRGHFADEPAARATLTATGLDLADGWLTLACERS